MSHDHNADARMYTMAETFGFRVFYAKPGLHQGWQTEQTHRKVTWTELFFDLFYVVASINLGHLISEEDVWSGVAHLALYYLLFWFAWTGHTLFNTRMKIPGLLFDIWQLLYMLGVFGMVITCSDTKYHQRFAVALTIVKWMLALAYIVAALTIVEAKRLGLMLASQHFVAGLAALISSFTSLEVFYGLMIAVILVDVLWVQLLLIFRKVHLPLHVDHTSERYGLIMIIFLGESIVSLGLQKPGDSVDYWLMLIFGVVVVWSLHLIYYHLSAEQHYHALRISSFRGLSWSFAHAILGFFFLCLGASLRLTAESYMEAGAGGHRRRTLLASGEVKEGKNTEGAFEAPHTAPKKAGEHESVKTEHHDLGLVHSDTAWLMCASYGLSLHFFGFIRALHFLDFRPDHWWNNIISELGLKWVTYMWWLFNLLYPFPIYFIAFAYDQLHGTWMVAVIAAHGLLFIVVETCITHYLAKHNALQTNLNKVLVKVESERNMKRKSSGAKGRPLHEEAHGGDSVNDAVERKVAFVEDGV